MNILAIETTSSLASVAIINDKQECTQILSDGSLTHLQRLMPMIDQALKESCISLREITGLAVSRGPGSFTGVRIGVSTARALAQVLGVKIAPVPTLLAMANSLKARSGVVCPILDARRNQVYSAGYFFENGVATEIFPEGAYPLDDVIAYLKPHKQICFMGDGVVVFEDYLTAAFGKTVTFASPERRMQKAAAVAEMGLAMFRRGETVDYLQAEPEYLRKSEAERNLERQQQK